MFLLTLLLQFYQISSENNPNTHADTVSTSEHTDASPLFKYEPQHTTINPTEHDQRDLEAQEAMALWAKRTFYISLASSVVSLIGLIAIVYSLRLNDDATIAAQHAVSEARRSNDIQNRAWLSVSCDVEDLRNDTTQQTRVDGLYVNVVCSVKNHGNAPAIGVRLNVEADVIGSHRPDIHAWLTEFSERWINAPTENTGCVFPGATVRLAHYVFLPHDIMLGAATTNSIGAVFPQIIGCISYAYPAGISRAQTRFHFHLAAPGEHGFAKAVVPTAEGKLTGVIGVCHPIATYTN